MPLEPGVGRASSDVDAAEEYVPPFDKPKEEEEEGFCCCEPDLPRRCFRPDAFVGALSANSNGMLYFEENFL